MFVTKNQAIKALTKSQAKVVQEIETVLGLKLTTKPLSNAAFLIELPEGDRCGFSRLETLIIRAVQQYKLGRVEHNGVEQLAIFSE